MPSRESDCKAARSPVLLLLALAVGCQRQAPGPVECERVALRKFGVDERLLVVPKVRAAVDEEILICLTTPYDRKLVRCVDEHRDARACFAAFEARKRGSGRGRSEGER